METNLKATLEMVYRFVRFQAVAGDSSCASGWKPLVFPSILRHKCRLSAHVSGGVSLDTRKFIPRLSIGSACCNIRKCLAISRGTAVHLFWTWMLLIISASSYYRSIQSFDDNREVTSWQRFEKICRKWKGGRSLEKRQEMKMRKDSLTYNVV